MILAAAQTSPKADDVKANLRDHYELIDIAYKHGADLIIFPEMSITGYEREKAVELTFTENDTRLDELRQLSVDKQIIVIASAPICIKGDLYIGAFIIQPDRSLSIYTKQFLHSGEEQYFNASTDYNPIIKIDHERMSVAICADINHPQHAVNASRSNSTTYLAGIFFTPNGIQGAYKTLSGYASKYGMNVLMSNFCGQSWELEAGGESGFWDKSGKLIAKLNTTDPGLLLVEEVNDSWVGKVI